MRIAILTNSFPPDARGGSGQIAKLQFDWLVAQGHEVSAWVPEPFSGSVNSQTQTFKCQTSIPFPSLNQHRIFSRLIFHFEDLQPNAELVESIRSFKPDVLITHNLTGCGWGTPIMLKKAGIRWLHVLHDVQIIEPSGQIQSQESFASLRQAWRKYWSKKRAKALGLPDVVISPSNWLLNYHHKYNLFQTTESKVIPNPIKQANFEKRTSKSDSKTVLYVGRVSKDKGAEVLINAWKLFQQKFGVQNSEFRIRLVMVGDGPYLESIKQLNDPSIECLGALEHSKVAVQYEQASLLVFPTLLMENQPTVLLEAMSHRLNIIASDIGGVGELLNGYGSLVPPGDSEKLSDSILEQIGKKSNLALGREIVNHHQIYKVMQEYLSILSVDPKS